MPLHLIKLCVGVETVDDLREWRAQRAAHGEPPIVNTRQTPKRAAEVIGGGSLYWVIKGQILVRQAIRDIESLEIEGRSHCRILLAPDLILTAPQPRRAFQGWRYFEVKDMPPDLDQDGACDPMPQALAQQLREIGAW